MTSFEEKNYESHKSQFDKYSLEGSEARRAQNWLDPETVDSWRHERIYASLNPLLDMGIGSTWLTVGDGRYGLDAQFLARKGLQAMASDISSTLLEEAAASGLISEYRVENAEQLSFRDNHFDCILCKDAYHHFPRPAKALYEMLRVARKAVVLIEPSDHEVHGKLLDKCMSTALKLRSLVLKVPLDTKRNYEECGNYVFRVSRREMEKIALGLDFPAIAFKGVNDYYEVAMMNELATRKGAGYWRARIAIGLLNVLSRLKLRDYRLLVVVFLKDSTQEDVLGKLESHGYEVVRLSRNPYL